MPNIDFYYVPGSPPCRSVRLTAAAVGVPLNLKLTNLMEKEHLKPEFLKMNPQHTIPTLNDNGFYLWESRAIMGYLVDQYGKNDSLYPKDPKKRAMVNQRLYFDALKLYDAFSKCYYPIILMGESKDPKKVEELGKALELLDKFLEGNDYVAGDNLTIADISIIVSVSTIELVKFDLSKYKNVVRWYGKIKSELPQYNKIEKEGIEAFSQFSAKFADKL